MTFTASSTSALLAWGGHISTHSDWGVGFTAVNISGSAYHMRLGSAVNNDFHDNTDNSSSTLGNQDRSMKLLANAFSSRLKVIKVGNPTDANSVFPFTLTQPQGATCDTAFALAKETGVSWVGAKRSNHAGAAGVYAAMTLPVRVAATFLRGEPTVLDGKAVK